MFNHRFWTRQWYSSWWRCVACLSAAGFWTVVSSNHSTTCSARATSIMVVRRGKIIHFVSLVYLHDLECNGRSYVAMMFVLQGAKSDGQRHLDKLAKTFERKCWRCRKHFKHMKSCEIQEVEIAYCLQQAGLTLDTSDSVLQFLDWLADLRGCASPSARMWSPFAAWAQTADMRTMRTCQKEVGFPQGKRGGRTHTGLHTCMHTHIVPDIHLSVC